MRKPSHLAQHNDGRLQLPAYAACDPSLKGCPPLGSLAAASAVDPTAAPPPRARKGETQAMIGRVEDWAHARLGRNADCPATRAESAYVADERVLWGGRY